jgi:hypothetical protein
MKDSWTKISGVVLSAVIVLTIVAPSLRAWPTAEGRFKLGYDIQLGEKMALPTGDYTFSVDRSAGSYGTISVYRGTEIVGTVLPQMLNADERQGEKPELLCIRHDGKVTVRALRLPQVGTFYFSLPKDLKVLVAQQPRLIETISAEISGE